MAEEVILTTDLSLEVRRPADSGKWVDITPFTYGLRSLRMNDRPGVTPHGQGDGRIGQRKNGHHQRDWPITVEVTKGEVAEIFMGSHGETVAFRLTKGGRVQTWSGPFMRTSLAGEAGGVVVVTGTSCVNGSISVS